MSHSRVELLAHPAVSKPTAEREVRPMRRVSDARMLRAMPDLSLTLDDSPATIAYADTGEGTPIVLVHGYPLDGRIWDDVAPQLISRSMRVIVPDLPGFGRSTLGASSFTMETMATALVALLDDLHIERAVFAGLSMGGYVLQALARRAPTRLAGLIFVDTRANADDEKGRAARDAMIALIAEKGTPGVVEQMLSKMVAPRTMTSVPITVARLREIMIDQPPATLSAACAAMRDRPDFMPLMAKLPCRLQVIVGESDAIAPPDVARAMYAAAPGARLDVIDHAGHMAPIEQSAAVARVIAEFAGGIVHAS